MDIVNNKLNNKDSNSYYSEYHKSCTMCILVDLFNEEKIRYYYNENFLGIKTNIKLLRILILPMSTDKNYEFMVDLRLVNVNDKNLIWNKIITDTKSLLNSINLILNSITF